MKEVRIKKIILYYSIETESFRNAGYIALPGE